MNNLPKFSQVNDPVIKSLIYLADMIRCGSSLKMVNQQATISGFDTIANSRTFKSAKSAIASELKNNGLIVI